MDAIKEVTLNNRTLKIFVENSPESPRSWDNLGRMICFHSRYNLGDKHTYNHNDYNGWGKMEKAIIKKEKVAVILPLFLYDHSGITIRTTPFGDRWDSGQVGFIIVSKEKLRKEYNVKRLNKKLIERATKHLISEVNTYDQYLIGDVYGFKVFENTTCSEGHIHEEETDSCWGFYGNDFLTNGILDYAGNEFAELLK